jgi:hypothetical protein
MAGGHGLAPTDGPLTIEELLAARNRGIPLEMGDNLVQRVAVTVR